MENVTTRTEGQGSFKEEGTTLAELAFSKMIRELF